jgi:hypothetical protein
MRPEQLAVSTVVLSANDSTTLDGGGWTAVLVRRAVPNSRSEGRERVTSDGMLVFRVQNLEGLTRLV